MISKELLQDKFRGAILGCFLGDAFGAGFEGMSPDRAEFHMSKLSKKFSSGPPQRTSLRWMTIWPEGPFFCQKFGR